MPTTLEARFWAKVNKTDNCWLWTAGVSAEGYGRIQRGGRGKGIALAHRLSWELHNGPIPEGLTIDHLCLNRRCVNPDHLEVVTRAENGRRSWITSNPADRPYPLADDTVACKNGHLEWTRVSGYRRCRACNREYMRRMRS